MDKRKGKFIGIWLIIILIFVVLIFFSTSFAIFKKQQEVDTVTLKVGELEYTMECSLLNNNQIDLPPNSNVVLDLKITSKNEIDSKYQLYYQTNASVSENFVVGYLEESTHLPFGTISKNGEIVVKVLFKNRTSENIAVTLGLEAGFTHNELNLDSNKKAIRQAVLNTSKLVINPNGGSWNGETANSSFEKNAGTYELISEPVREGYKFIGWDTSSSRLQTLGTSLYTDENFATSLNHIEVYNNLENDAVTIERVPRDDSSPIKDTNYMLKITSISENSPEMGGFKQRTISKILGTYYHVFVAKVPKGYSVEAFRNSIGNGGTIVWLTPHVGTGEFETYAYRVDCGTSGIFSSFGHVALSGPTPTKENPLIWYLSYSAMIDASAGNNLYTDTTFASGNNSMSVYDNLNSSNLIHERIPRSNDNPLLDSNYMIRIQNIGKTNPDLGGFFQSTRFQESGVYYHVVYAKVPLGYKLVPTSNSFGIGGGIESLTDRSGTGKFEKYIFRIRAGYTGNMTTFGFVYLTGDVYGTSTNPIVWDVGYATIFDASELEGNYATYLYKYGSGDVVITAKWIAV